MPSSSEEARSFPTSGLQTIEANQIVEEEKLYGYRADRFFAVQMEEAFQERYQTVANLEFWFVINYLANSESERPSICRRESACTSSPVHRELPFYDHTSHRVTDSSHRGRRNIRRLLDSFEVAIEGREIPDPTMVPVRDDRPNHPSLLELLGGDVTGCNAEQLRVKLQWHNNNKNLPDMAIHELQTINEDAMRDVERDLGANTLLVIEFGALRGADIAISTLSWHQTTEDISNKFLNSSSLPNSKRDLHLSACESMVEEKQPRSRPEHRPGHTGCNINERPSHRLLTRRGITESQKPVLEYVVVTAKPHPCTQLRDALGGNKSPE
ncbi:hypothetical protein ETB97_000411 [Aspergillus alliaceus]|uniref:Uncharacterized protein n=1 Tax=Petromyces alliaceus TaxID=209559 RepID=A0A8H6A664_PETAA|nr:hypothetical protein ETB97_000411 [Aspergillus burnettii]